MTEWLKTFLTHLLTGVDNRTFDIARVLWLASCLTFLVLAVWHVVANKQPFDAMAFGGGAAGVLAGGGAGVAIKKGAEPDAS